MDWQLGLRAATWLTLAFAFAAWLLALGSVYSMQNALGASARVLQFQWWLVVFQPVALLACAAAHGCAHLQGLRPGARATLCVLTPLVMLQTDTVNAQRQVAAVGAALVTALQSERAAAGRGGGGEAADTLAGLLARLASGADAGDRAALALMDMQSHADGLFLGFLFLGTLDLLLLWLLGASEAAGRAPRGMQRLHSSAASDLSKQGSAVRDLQLAINASAATLSPRAPHAPGQQLA